VEILRADIPFGENLTVLAQRSSDGSEMKVHRIAGALGIFSIGLGAVEFLAPGTVAKLLGARQPSWLRWFGLREMAAGLGILSGKGTAFWMWSRVFGDILDVGALLKLATSRRRNEPQTGVATAAVLGVTALDVWCATELSKKAGEYNRVVEKITVGRPAEDLYKMWRDPATLAQIHAHIAEVVADGEGVTSWILKGYPLEWHAKWIEEEPGKRLCWRSLDGNLHTAGCVGFDAGPGDRGVEVTLSLHYRMEGLSPLRAANFFKVIPEKLTRHALRRFKTLAETGEIPTLERNPTARSGPTANLI
jgi:uncharacterized membrane protein